MTVRPRILQRGPRRLAPADRSPGRRALDTLAGAIREGFAERGRGRALAAAARASATGAARCCCAARGCRGGGGYVVVFDDVTQLIAAQRATAWGEVARRLAHEIKNPLTPIQLSAERLQAKLADRLAPADARDARARAPRPSSTRWRR